MNDPKQAVFSNKNFKLGILGGGQLGKMLLYDTRRLDIYTKVLDPSPEAPCRLSANEFVVGSLTDFDTVYQFGKGLDALTIEIENVNIEALEALEQTGVIVHPAPAVLRKIQSKADQKIFFKKQQLPTAPFLEFDGLEALKKAVADGTRSLPFVWKIARGGYDGFGVQIVRTPADLDNLADGHCIAEDLIPFEMELGVVVCRNSAGQALAFPTVEMAFHPVANQVEFVVCPARVAPNIAQAAEKLAIKVAEAFDVCGLLAVELFLTKSGEILVNEVAPRPHNSGHLTIEACYTSQFEQHLRGVLNFPLGSTALKTSAVMANLVGAEGHSGPVDYRGYHELLALGGVHIHIYGKAETRPFRKMGHVTTIHQNLETALQLARQAKEQIQVIARP
jgi:5-(carboxyamino)imidazole ribonucleotide synthase